MTFPPLLPVLAALGVVVLALVLFLFVCLDLYYELHDEAPLEDRMTRWASRFPLLAGGLVAVLGALLSHFFWQH